MSVTLLHRGRVQGLALGSVRSASKNACGQRLWKLQSDREEDILSYNRLQPWSKESVSLYAPLFPSEERKEWSGHQGRYERHQHHHAEETLRKNVEFVAKVESDQLHQAASVHERT